MMILDKLCDIRLPEHNDDASDLCTMTKVAYLFIVSMTAASASKNRVLNVSRAPRLSASKKKRKKINVSLWPEYLLMQETVIKMEVKEEFTHLGFWWLECRSWLTVSQHTHWMSTLRVWNWCCGLQLLCAARSDCWRAVIVYPLACPPFTWQG